MTDVNPKFPVGTDVKKGITGYYRYRVKDSRKSADGTSYVYDIENQTTSDTEFAVPESKLMAAMNQMFATQGQSTGGKRSKTKRKSRKTKRKSRKIKRKSMKKGRKIRRKSMKKGGCK